MDALSLLAPVSGIIGGISTAITNKKNRQFQREMWDKTNAYNTPLAQRQRMEQAGFNPNMMYGSGTVANTASPQNLPDATPPDFTSALAGTLGQYQDIRNKRVDMQMQQQNLANAKVMEDKYRAEAFKANSEALAAAANLPEDMKKSLLANKLTQSNIENVAALTEATKSNMALNPFRESQMVADTYLKQMQAYQMPAQLKNATTDVKARVALSMANIRNLDSAITERLKKIGYMDTNQMLNVGRIVNDIQAIRLRNKGQSVENVMQQTRQHWQKLGLTTEMIRNLSPLLLMLL